jgi:acyl dehydratase
MNPGEIVIDEQVPGSTREAIALFSKATQDPNPIHVDEVFAAECGFPQVIQQGPMTTAHFARLLAARFGHASLKVVDVSFVAPVFPLEALRLTATVAADQVGGAIKLDLLARKQDGTVTAKGVAEVTLS